MLSNWIQAHKKAVIHLLKFTKPDFAIRNYKPARPGIPVDTATIVNDPLHLRWNPAEWNILVRHVIIEDGFFP